MYFLQNATSEISHALTPLQDIAKALQDADRTNTYLVIFTAILAGATILFGLWDRRRTRTQIRRSEERQDNEQFERMRPWISIKEAIPLQALFQNQAISWDRYIQIAQSSPPPDKVRVGMQIANTGLRPARNLKKIDFGQNAAITRNEIENKEEENMNIDLGVNQTHYNFYDISWSMYDKSNETPVYFALRISYDNGRDRGYSGAIYKILRTQSNVVATWYT